MRTITVKGIGKAKAKPDQVVLWLNFETLSLDYQKAMDQAGFKIADLTDALVSLGFEKEDIKTLDFDVSTRYERKKDYRDHYYNEFVGYEIRHRLKFSFDFETKRLSQVLTTVSGLALPPEISLSFSVNDKESVKEEILVSAAENAREKARILCRASGVTLGEIQTVDYNWGEVSFYSPTKYSMLEECASAPTCCEAGMGFDIEPEEISASDSVTFVWEILP